jgi:polyisoprenyl-teichoic acid--peptidoglycan teichoic acid transferase
LKTKLPSKLSKSQKRRKKSTVSPVLQGLIWGSCFTLTAAFSALVGMSFALKTPLPIDFTSLQETIAKIKILGLRGLTVQQLQQPINILLMGIDKVPENPNNPTAQFSGRSDTMLLVRFNPTDASIKVLSIPRDTRIKLPNGEYNKINSANAIGGIDYTKQTINDNLNGLTVDKYIRVTSNAFEKLIDAVGGIDVYVPKDLKYKDQTQGLYIDLKQGQQILNGSQAEGFVRFRNDGLGDIGRIQRQQILLKALREKIQSPSSLLQVPKIWKVLETEVDTDLTQGEVFNLIAFSLALDKENIRMLLLPGRASSPREYRASYWLVSEQEQDKIIQEYLNGESTSNNNDSSPLESRITVYNTTDSAGLAKKTASLLAQNGYTNVSIIKRHDYPPMAKTQIIVQKGDSESAKQIQKSINLGELDYSSIGSLNSDITILLGEDAQISP